MSLVRKLLCKLGFHAFDYKSYGYGDTGTCRHCGTEKDFPSNIC